MDDGIDSGFDYKTFILTVIMTTAIILMAIVLLELHHWIVG